MAGLRLAGALRRSHRLRRSKANRRTRRPDLRRTVRRAAARRRRTDRAGVRRAARAASADRAALRRQRLDGVRTAGRWCGSCTPPVVGRSEVEAFALGTRLTRITRELSSPIPTPPSPPRPPRVTDWSGGTRLGEGLRQFNDEWGVRGMARGAVVVILSDGWDRGEPDDAGRADGAAAAGRAPGGVGEPAQGRRRATRRWPAEWPRPCRTWTSSSRATPSRRSSSWPKSSPAVMHRPQRR